MKLEKKLDELVIVFTGILKTLALLLAVISVFLFWIFIGILAIFGGNSNVSWPIRIEFVCAIVIIPVVYYYLAHTLIKNYAPEERAEEEPEEEESGEIYNPVTEKKYPVREASKAKRAGSVKGLWGR